MWRLVGAIAISLLAADVQAETVEVRSGVHPTFTRLVLHMPERVGFRMLQDGSDHRLTLERDGMEFRLNSIFDRIGKERLAAVAPLRTGSGLRLELACQCRVDASWAGTAMLVLDIREDPNAELPERATGDTPDRALSKAPSFAVPLTPKGSGLVATARDLVAAGFQFGSYSGETVSGLATASESSPNKVAKVDTISMRHTLLREISRATAQNLLTPRRHQSEPTPQSGAKGAPDRPQSEEATSGSETPSETSLSQANMATTTAMNLPGAMHSTAQTPDGGPCLKAEYLDVAAWNDDTEFSVSIGRLRSEMSGEFDKTDPETALRLARTFVFFGFGAEARQALMLIEGEDTVAARVVRAMAEIVDNGSASAPGVLDGQAACDTNASFWSALAQDPLPPALAINQNAMQRTLGELPAHLRDHLGPVLARRLLAAGHRKAADRILRRLNRTPEAASDEERLARAEAGLASGTEGASEADLDAVVAGNSNHAATALVHSIDTRLAAGRGIAEDMAELAGSYALEFRDEPVGKDLIRAYIAAIAGAGDFGRAFTEFERLTPDLDEAAVIGLNDVLMQLLERNAKDLTFIAQSIRFSPEDVPLLDTVVANTVAQRLLSLGFPDAASRFVDQPAEGRAGRDRRIIRAEIALSLGHPRNAEVALLGLQDDEANLLRAQAREMTGETDAARILFASAGRDKDARRTAIEAEDWAQVPGDTAPDIAELAAGLTDGAEPENPEAPLGSGRALLTESSVSRQRIKAMLSARPLADD
ncbi:hypothetical protein [Roseovarius sp. E0-M6]|uniref:hypothetical protein n=1 Tax=Roseovarius sp. E0-M6 TaxID=3127118 RepID=UPI0030103EA0